MVAAARRRDRLDALRGRARRPLRPVTLDVTSADSVAALAAEVGGALSVLVNNAGGAFGTGAGRRGRRRPTGGRCTRSTCIGRAARDPGAAAGAGGRAGRGTSWSWARPPAASSTRAVAATRRPSTARPRWPRRCGSSSTGSRCGSPRSRPAWCATEEFSLTRFRGDAERGREGLRGCRRPADRRRHRRLRRVVRDPAAARRHRPAGGQAAGPGGAAQGAPHHRLISRAPG